MRRAVTLGGLSGVNVLLSFLFQWYIFTHLGPGRETDALFAGMVVPQLILMVVSGSLTHVLVPLLSSDDDPTFHRDAWMFFQGILLLFGTLGGVLMLLAPHWVGWIVPGFDAETVRFTVGLVRIQLIGMVFTAGTSVLWSAYHARQRFIWAEASPILASVMTFPLLVWSLPRLGVAAAAWTLVLKLGIQMAFLLPGLGRYHRPRFRTAAAREAWRRIRPLLLGTSFYKTEQLVDRFLASMASAGSLSLLHLSTQLYGAGHQVLNTAVAAPMVPLLARHAKANDWSSFRDLSRHRLRLMLALTAAGLLVLLLAGRPILSLLFEHGRFNGAEIQQLWILLVALSGTWIGGAAGQILSTSFYAKGDTVTPTRIGVIGYTAGIGLKIGGFYAFGVVGIAAGTSIYLLFNAVVMAVFLHRSVRRDLQLSPVAGGALSQPSIAG
jgi:putative peptidoglycan lipid II flippase